MATSAPLSGERVEASTTLPVTPGLVLYLRGMQPVKSQAEVKSFSSAPTEALGVRRRLGAGFSRAIALPETNGSIMLLDHSTRSLLSQDRLAQPCSSCTCRRGWQSRRI